MQDSYYDDIEGVDDDEILTASNEEEVEDIQQIPHAQPAPEVNPVSAQEVAIVLEQVKKAGVSFKLGNVLFKICSVNTRAGTLTAKPVNKIIGKLPKIRCKRKKTGRK